MGVPPQTPILQLSLAVQRSPSSQVVPLALGGSMQPASGSQVAPSRHGSDVPAGQTTGAPPHTPAVQWSSVVHWLLS